VFDLLQSITKESNLKHNLKLLTTNSNKRNIDYESMVYKTENIKCILKNI